MVEEKKAIPPEVRAYLAEIGRKSGRKLMETRGSEYFSKISKMRKTYGRQGKSGQAGSNTFQSLGDTYNITRQRVQQIIKKHGQTLVERSLFIDEASWREAVMKRYFRDKSQGKRKN